MSFSLFEGGPQPLQSFLFGTSKMPANKYAEAIKVLIMKMKHEKNFL